MARGTGRPLAALILSVEERSFLEAQVRRHRVARSMSVVKPPPARRSGSVAGVTGACVCDGWGLNWLRVG